MKGEKTIRLLFLHTTSFLKILQRHNLPDTLGRAFSMQI